MLRKSAVISAAGLFAISAAMAGQDPFSSDLATMNLPNLVSLHESMNDQCRGGSGDSPDTERYCDRRDVIYKEIESRGWCWGPDNASGADKSWIECQVKTNTPVPRYDAKEHCRSLATAGGSPSESLFGGCMTIEQDAYNKLKSNWNSIPATVRKHCDSLATLGGTGSYSMLSACIEQELAAKSENAKRAFAY